MQQTEDQTVKQLRNLDSDVREAQREIVLRLDRIERCIERESTKWDWKLFSLKMDMTTAAYLVVLILVSALVIATKVIVNHL